MFSSLPTELLREVIEATVPHTFHSNTYKDRQRNLCSLSLVSKLFRSIAQPLLLEIVLVESVAKKPIHATRARSGGQDKGGNTTRWAVVDLHKGTLRSIPDDKETVGTVLSMAGTAETVTLAGVPQVKLDLARLGLPENLSTLHLSGPGWYLKGSLVLPNLRSLTFYDVRPTLLIGILSPTILPNLEELALVEYEPSLPTSIRRSPLKQLLPQLRALYFDVETWEDLTFLHSAASRTLLDCPAPNIQDLESGQYPVINVRLYNMPEKTLDGETFVARQIKSYAAYINSTPSLPLRSIYFHDSKPISQLHPEVQVSLRALINACQERKIDFIWETFPARLAIDRSTSPGFLRRQKELFRNENSG